MFQGLFIPFTQFFYFFDDADIFCRVAGTITEHDSVGLHFDYFFGSGIIWNYGNLAAAFFEFALNVELGAEVEENDVMCGGVAGAGPRREGSGQANKAERIVTACRGDSWSDLAWERGRDFSLLFFTR